MSTKPTGKETTPTRVATDEHVARRLIRDAGVATVEILSWSAMLVVAIVAIAALLQTLGLDVINYVRSQIGL